MSARYQLLRPLGSGGAGQVHLARDLAAGAQAPLLAAKGLTAGDAVLEVEVLRAFAHPGIVRVLDVDLSSTPPLLLEELIDGPTLDRAARGAGRDEIVGWVLEVLEALAALHARGLVHGDVKPANVLLRSSGTERHPVLVDFGLCRRLGARHGGLSGTLLYAAPEVLTDAPVTPGRDVYATGLMAIELLAGRHPFAGLEPATLLHAHQESAIAAPPGVSAPVEAALLALVEKTEAERPSAAAAALRLCEALGRPASATQRFRAAVATAPLVEREEALAALTVLLPARAAQSEGAAELDGSPAPTRPLVLNVIGAAGAGRSRFCREASHRARLAGCSVISLEPGPESFDAVRRTLLALGERDIQSFDDPPADRWTQVDRVATLMVEAVTSRPALLVVDRSELLDAESRDTLRVALTRLAFAEPASGALRVVLAGSAPLDIPSNDGVSVSAPLAPLSPSGISRWVEAVFSSGARPPRASQPTAREREDTSAASRPEALVGALQRLTQGHPGHIATLLEALLESGEVSVHEGVPALAEHLSGLPAGIEEALARRLAALTSEERDVLDLVRAARTAIPTGLLATAAGLDQQRTESAVAGLVTAGLLTRREGGALRSELPLTAPPERTADLHYRLARATLGLGARETVAGFGLDAAAHHAAVAARHGDRRLAGIAWRAGVASLDGLRGLPLRRLLDDLTVLAPDEAERGQILLRAAAAWRASGDLAEAATRAEAAAATPPASVEAALLLAELALDSGRLEEAHEKASKLDLPPERSGEAAAVAARASILLGRYEDGARVARGALSGDLRDPALAGRLRQSVALAAYYTNEAESARDAFEASAKAFAEAGDLSGQAAAVNGVGLIAHRRGDFDAAVAAYEESHRLAVLSGDRKRAAIAAMNVGTVLQETGRTAAAAERYRESLAASDLVGDEGAVARAANNLGNALTSLGRLGEALHWLDRSDALARQHGMRLVLAYNLALRGKVHHRRGELPDARRCLVTALDSLREMGSSGEAGELSVELGLIERTALDPNGMEHFAAAAEQQARASGAEKQLSAIAFLRGEAHRLRGDSEAALEKLREALTLADRHHQKELGWLAEAALGRVHRERGNSLEARTRLSAAAERLLADAQDLAGRERELFLGEPERAKILEEARQAADTGQPLPRADIDRLLRILEINRRLVSERDVQRLLEHILDEAISLTGAERGFVILGRPSDGADLDVRAARNIDHESLKKHRARVSTSVLRDVVETGEAILTVDAGEDARFRDAASVHALKLRSILCLPLRAHGKTFGAIYLDNRFQTSTFSDRDLPTAGAFADQASVALENARLHEEAATAQRELAASHARVEALNRELEKRLEDQATRLAEAESHLERQRTVLETRYRYDNIVGQSPPMKRLFGVLDRVTDTSVPVLVQGESGTGKELVARAIHFNSARKDHEFVSVNCAALTETLLESELFGHVKGAFTGSERDRKGLFEVADRGTLFLDEVADMSLGMQAKLLRALQEGEIWPVGARRAIRVDVRIVAACNRDLADLVRDGSFRQDLFFRLNVVRVVLPPLRERGEDIALLVHRFMDRLGKEQGRNFRISQGAMDRLLRYEWPGNVRELEACVLNACLFSDGEVLSDAHFAHKPELYADRRPNKKGAVPPLPGASGHELLDLANMTLDALEERAILASLEASSGNKVEAARRLGVTRQTLYNKLKALNIEIRRDIRRMDD